MKTKILITVVEELDKEATKDVQFYLEFKNLQGYELLTKARAFVEILKDMENPKRKPLKF